MAVIVSPSLLSADFANLKSDIEVINRSEAEWLHLDIMDGVFVPNISFGFPIIKAVAGCCTKLLDAHFMIVNPEKYVQRTAELGVMMMTVHAEVCQDLHKIIADIHKAGMKAGVAVNPESPLSLVEPILNEADMILVMSVHPGFSGQKFIEGSAEKVEQLRKMRIESGSKALIQVDGGINGEIAENLVKAGADVIVCGNYIFKADDPIDVIRQLHQITI
jgi:ribulose-phosphate 3-epimerase